MKIYNTLTRSKEEFLPLMENRVRMYVCGITPYEDSHLGHARCYVVFDVIRRYLIHKGYDVTYIQNFTDIDDKIIKKAHETNCSWQDISQRFIDAYFNVMDLLHVMRADEYPRVTHKIPEIIKFIQTLILKGYAYNVNGNVFFSVEKFPDYGKLSNRRLDQMKAGARVEVDENKQNSMDFALWKKAKKSEPFWDSPWGNGRPGWHIECSVMSIQQLGNTFDIHGGGQDLIFPHHENEIAQSEACTGEPFVRYWLHNGFVTVNREKMSKSLGNFFTLKEIFAKYSHDVVRLFLLSQHYRGPIDFSPGKLDEAQKGFNRMHDTYKRVNSLLTGKADEENRDDYHRRTLKKFEKVMDDDFNTAEAMASIYDLVFTMNKEADKESPDRVLLDSYRKTLVKLLGILGLYFPKEILLSEEDLQRIRDREKYRSNKEWAKADQIRNEFEQKGITIEDTAQGTCLKRRLPT